MVAPVVIGLVKIYLIKKIALYYVAKQYGIHRLYRRALEGMKVLKIEKQNQKIISKQLKIAIRFPNNAYQALSESNTASYLQNFFTNLEKLSQQIPNFPLNIFRSFHDILYTQIPFIGRIIDLFSKKW